MPSERDQNCPVSAIVDFGRGPVEVRCTETGEHTEHRSEVFITPDIADGLSVTTRVALALGDVLGHTRSGIYEPAPNTVRMARELIDALEREHGLHVMESPIA